MWGISQGNILPIVSGQAFPVIDPLIVQTITQAATPQGSIGLVATLTTPENNIICLAAATVDTGSAP